jgi:hypothetical protein
MKQLSRRTFLGATTLSGAAIRFGLPPLEAMFNSSGTAYAASTAAGRLTETPIESRFLVWFNGNGIPERYWIPTETGTGFRMTPCLAPLGPFRDDIHVFSGLDNDIARVPGPGNDHHRSMSGLMTGIPFTGRGAGGASIDQAIAAKIGGRSRFRSLQVGVCPESHGDSIQRNMSWAGKDRALPPELIPQNLFDRIFGIKDPEWVDRKKSVLDTVQESSSRLKDDLGRQDQARLEDYLASIRDLERAIGSLPPEYAAVEEPEISGDMKDWPRIAKIQSDLLVHAFASGQTRVASYMLTKCQSLTRMPWLGYTTLRHDDYTHNKAQTPSSQRVMRDICRWHVQEFAYLLGRLKSIPEGDGTLLDNTCLLYLHEHAEANAHKNNGMIAIAAGHVNGMSTGRHTETTGTMGDLYLTIADDVMKAGVEGFPNARGKLLGVV